MDENLEMLYVIVSKYLLQTQTDCNDCNLCHCIEIELVGFYYIFPRFLEVLLQISWQILFIAEFLQNYADTIMQTSLFIIKWFVYFSMQHNIINTFLQTRICTFVWVLNNLPKPTLQKKLCYLKAFGQARNIVSGKVIFLSHFDNKSRLTLSKAFTFVIVDF